MKFSATLSGAGLMFMGVAIAAMPLPPPLDYLGGWMAGFGLALANLPLLTKWIDRPKSAADTATRDEGESR